MTFKFPPFWTLAGLIGAVLLNDVPVLQVSSRVFGGVVLVAGLLLVAWAAWGFKGRNTPIHPGHTPKALISTGAFALNRNPIYSGMVLLVAGVGLSQGSLLGLLPAAILWWALDRHFAAPEEAALIEAFGAEGEEYIARTRRW